MPLPIQELITVELESTLESIHTSNGYHFDLTVERASKIHVPKDSLCVLDMNPPERDTEGCLLHDTWYLNYTATIYVSTSDAWEQSVTERMALAANDVYTAVMADPHRGAYALNTEMGSPSYNNEADGMPAVDVPIKVHFRHLQGQPNSL